MKRLAAILAFTFTFGLMSFCAASISIDDCVLGGIAIRSNAEYVKSVYGEPTRITRSLMHDLPMYEYGDSFYIVFSDDMNFVQVMGTTANNGIATSKGISVGMKRMDVLGAYGTPTKTGYDNKRRVTSCFYDAGYSYFGIVFKINPETDQVTDIFVGMLD